MIYGEIEQKYLSRGDGVPYSKQAFDAAEKIYNLYKNNTYFASRNEEHRLSIIEGWAMLIHSTFEGETMPDGYKEEWGSNFCIR